MEFVLFTSIYFFLCNWYQLQKFLSTIVGPKYKTSILTNDSWIKSSVLKKSGLHLSDITLIHDPKMYALMPGFPFWPKMIISEGLIKTLSKSELEWVILHETAHCIFWHNLQFAFIQFSIYLFGLYTSELLNFSLIINIFYSLFLSMISIQVMRWAVEYPADRYAISRMDDPRSAITAQAKFKPESPLWHFLLHWNIPRSTRIQLAQKRIASE